MQRNEIMKLNDMLSCNCNSHLDKSDVFYCLYANDVIQLINENPSKYCRVLDIGCGPWLKELRILASMGVRECIGIDVLPPAINLRDISNKSFFFSTDQGIILKTKLIDGGTNLESIRADIEMLCVPIKDSTIDLVLLNNTIEHLYDPISLLTECIRILKDGGNIAILTPNQAHFVNRLQLLRGKSIYYPIRSWIGETDERIYRKGKWHFAGHIREYTLEEILLMLRSVGFEIQMTKIFPFILEPKTYLESVMNRIKHQIVRLVGKAFPDAGYMISVIAKKPKAMKDA